MSTTETDRLQTEIEELEGRLRDYGTAPLKARIAALQRQQMDAAGAEAAERAKVGPLLAEATQELRELYDLTVDQLDSYVQLAGQTRAARARYEASVRRARSAGLADIEPVAKFSERCAALDGLAERHLRDAFTSVGRLEW